MLNDELTQYCDENCDHEGKSDMMPTCEELGCCIECYLDHYYLNDQITFVCVCKCHTPQGTTLKCKTLDRNCNSNVTNGNTKGEDRIT